MSQKTPLTLALALLLTMPYSAIASTFGPTMLVNTENFTIIDDAGGTGDVELRFGDTVNERLYWNAVQSRFEFTDDVHVQNNLSGSGTLRIEGNVATKADLFLNADNGASNAVLTFGNDTLPESLQFNRLLSRFEFSDDLFVADTLSASGAVFFEGNMTVDNGLLTVDAAANEVGIGTTAPHSTLTLSGSISTPMRIVTAAYALDATDHTILADATTAAFTVTLPTAVGVNGRQYVIKKTDAALANIITVATTGGQTIDGQTTWRLDQRNETLTVKSDGGNWRRIEIAPYDVSTFRTKGSTRNQWHTSPNTGVALTTGSPSINTLRAIPFVVSKTVTIDQMAINVTTAGAGSNARVGIYADDGNNYPGARIVDAGSIATATTGVKTYTTGLPVTLQPGLYWLAIVGNGTAPALRTFNVTSLNPVLGYASTLPTNAQFGWSVAYPFAALPATFNAGGVPITAVPIPAIFVRISQ